MFRFRILLMLALFGLLFATFAKGQPAHAQSCGLAATQIFGVVIDPVTFQPIEGAEVTAVTIWEGDPNNPNDDVIHNSTNSPSYSDSNGHFTHTNGHCGGSATEAGFYKIEKDGYKPSVYNARFPVGFYAPYLIHQLEPANGADVLWAGLRSSSYGPGIGGIDFPPKGKWETGMNEVASNWNTAVPASIWGVSEVRYCSDGVPEACGTTFEFADPGGINDQYIGFDATKRDHHEYLNLFDAAGIKVFLGIEPGWADIDKAIEIALDEYGYHPSVAGVSVDIEFYHFDADFGNTDPANTQLKVSYDDAERWEMLVKNYDPHMQLVLKHFFSTDLDGGYYGDIIFVDDTQDMGSLNGLLEGNGGGEGMIDFARAFPNNDVMYQIGYPADWFDNSSSTPTTNAPWFCKISPWEQPGPCDENSIPANQAEQLVSELGNALKNATPDAQNIGIIWVDFTMGKLYPDIFDSSPVGVDDWSPHGVWYDVGDLVSYDGDIWENTYAHWSNVAYYPGAPGLWFWQRQ